MTIRLSKRTARALGHTHSLTVTLTGRATAPGTSARTNTQRITLGPR